MPENESDRFGAPEDPDGILPAGRDAESPVPYTTGRVLVVFRRNRLADGMKLLDDMLAARGSAGVTMATSKPSDSQGTEAVEVEQFSRLELASIKFGSREDALETMSLVATSDADTPIEAKEIERIV